MSKVKWRSRAIADVERLYGFLLDKDATAAKKMTYSLSDGASLLESTSRIGRPMSDSSGRRELFIPFGVRFYVIRYMLSDNDIVLIVRVWHSRENRVG